MSGIAFTAEGIVSGRHVGDGLGKPPLTAPRGRVCASPDCTAVLSIYNVDDDRCAPCLRRDGTIVRGAGAGE